MTAAIRRFWHSIRADFQAGRNIETYLIVVFGAALIVVDLFSDILSAEDKLTLIIAVLILLVFKTRSEITPEQINGAANRVISELHQKIDGPVDLNRVLRDRQGYGPLREFFAGGTELCVYSASAVNLLRNTGDIQRHILNKPDGKLRVIIQDPNNAPAVEILRQQLDKMHHLENDIRGVLYTLDTIKQQFPDKSEYRLLSYSPGFSMTIIDPHKHTGRLVIEFYGFRNDAIEERMHIHITCKQSEQWFNYWVSQFELMWNEASVPQPFISEAVE